MKAIYNNRICVVVDTRSDLILSDEGQQFTVSFGDPRLVVDPTDEQVADADNLRDWYGLENEDARDFVAMLRRRLSVEAWQTLKAVRR